MIVVCAWEQTNVGGVVRNAPVILRDYPDVLGWTDITGTPAVPCEPNLVVLEVTATDPQAAALRTNPEYLVLEERPDEAD